jgi:hypothetical protein
MAMDETFQARMETTLFKAAVTVLSADPGVYTPVRVAAAKRIINGYIPIRTFCLAAVNDPDLGGLIDDGAVVGALTDQLLMAAAAATVGVMAAGAI